MAQRYEILIRFDEKTGELKGGHYRETPFGDASPIREADWSEELKGVNVTALATNEVQAEAIVSLGLQLQKMEEDHAKEIQRIEAEKKTAVDAFNAQTLAIQAERDAAAATLSEHQQIADSITNAAEAILTNPDSTDNEKVNAILDILPQARLFGKAREKSKIEAEIRVLQQKAAALDT